MMMTTMKVRIRTVIIMSTTIDGDNDKNNGKNGDNLDNDDNDNDLNNNEEHYH